MIEKLKGESKETEVIAHVNQISLDIKEKLKRLNYKILIDLEKIERRAEFIAEVWKMVDRNMKKFRDWKNNQFVLA